MFEKQYSNKRLSSLRLWYKQVVNVDDIWNKIELLMKAVLFVIFLNRNNFYFWFSSCFWIIPQKFEKYISRPQETENLFSTSRPSVVIIVVVWRKQDGGHNNSDNNMKFSTGDYSAHLWNSERKKLIENIKMGIILNGFCISCVIQHVTP